MTSEDYPPPVVLDTTVLSCFASSEDLHLLDTLSIRFVTVEAVIEELRTGVELEEEPEPLTTITGEPREIADNNRVDVTVSYVRKHR